MPIAVAPSSGCSSRSFSALNTRTSPPVKSILLTELALPAPNLSLQFDILSSFSVSNAQSLKRIPRALQSSACSMVMWSLTLAKSGSSVTDFSSSLRSRARADTSLPTDTLFSSFLCCSA